MTVERTYTYRAKPALDADQTKIVAAMVELGGLLSKHSEHVKDVIVQLDGEEIEIRLTMLGHDQWWIKKRVVYPISRLLTGAGLHVDQARLVEVTNPNDRRTKDIRAPRASDGRRLLPDEDDMVDHSDMMA